MNNSSRQYQICIIHGSNGEPTGNWFPWLRVELEARGHIVVVPKFPTPQKQTLDSWRSTFLESFGSLTESSILIGHSVGAALALNLLNDSPNPIAATFLAAGFLGPIGHPYYDPLNTSFFAQPFDWSKIRKNAGATFIYSGDDDPNVPLEKGKQLAEALNTLLTIVKNGGHLNKESGYTRFNQLLTDFETWDFETVEKRV
jgi:predicted alpha/beta hydrolase family esterase